MPQAWTNRSGQAYIETLIALLVLMVFLFGFLQVALSVGGADILHHAAARAARARAVGFNQWMAEKAARVAAIPVSGALLSENMGYNADEDGTSAEFELARIPEYLASENYARAQYILDYSEWDRGSFSYSEDRSALGSGILRYSVRQEFPLEMPFLPLIFPAAERDENGVPRVVIESKAAMGEHASLYLK